MTKKSETTNENSTPKKAAAKKSTKDTDKAKTAEVKAVSPAETIKEQRMGLIGELVRKAKEGGNKISSKDVMDLIEASDIDIDQADKVMEKLEGLGIEVIADNSTEEEADTDIDVGSIDGIGVDDPVRMYLKEIGKVPLLTADQEKELAQRCLMGTKMLRTLFVKLICVL
jgi:RNA polymerase primary sigma factor